MGRLRRRLDRLENHAHETMDGVQALLADFLADLADGVDFELVRTGDATLADFLAGKVDKFPLKIRMVAKEDQ